MIYKIFPTKDATLYSQYPNRNSGLDPILEVSSYLNKGVRYKNRYLTQFSTTEIESVVDDLITGSFVANLKLYNANTTGLNLDTDLYLHTVSGSWGMGTGRYADSPQTVDGTSWNYRDYSGSIEWETEGGDYNSSPIYSQSFGYRTTKDVKMDVTTTVHSWYSGSTVNDGFLMRLTSSVEDSTSTSVQPLFKHFSTDTHTIYPPHLEFKWDDSTFDTGSSTSDVLTSPSAFISMYNNVGTYYSESISRFRIAAIPKYPTRTFQTSSLYTLNYYLPENNSLYAIKDSSTNEFVIDFDSDYTKISADATSSYFDVYMDGLQPQRTYEILIKTQINNQTIIFNEGINFEIEL